MQSKLGIKNCTISSMSDTRWACRYKNCEAILNNYAAIVQCLRVEIDANTDRHVAEAIGMYFCYLTQ